MIRGLAIFVFILAAVYSITGLWLYFTQSRLIYYPEFPDRQLTATPADAGLAFKNIHLQTADDVDLHGWFIPADTPRGTLLFFHGNAGNISQRLHSLGLFHRLGLNVLIIDYRGYGQSGGIPSERGTYRDSEAAWDYLVEERSADPARIVLFGRSLGGAIAARLASRQPAAGLIVESGFTSATDMAAATFPFFPVRWMSRFRYPTKDYLHRTKVPVLIVHSRDDEIIPFLHGQRLFEAANQPKCFLELSGGHNDAFLVSGSRYREGLEDFLDESLSR